MLDAKPETELGLKEQLKVDGCCREKLEEIPELWNLKTQRMNANLEQISYTKARMEELCFW